MIAAPIPIRPAHLDPFTVEFDPPLHRSRLRVAGLVGGRASPPIGREVMRLEIGRRHAEPVERTRQTGFVRRELQPDVAVWLHHGDAIRPDLEFALLPPRATESHGALEAIPVQTDISPPIRSVFGEMRRPWKQKVFASAENAPK